MTRGRGSLLIVLAVCGAQAGAYGVYRLVQHARDTPETDVSFELEAASGRAPEIELTRPDGTTVILSELRGRVVVLHFWATWCAPCARELPGLLAFADDVASTGVTVLAVSLDDSWKNVSTFLGGSVPESVVRAGGDAARLYGVGPIPQTFLVRPNGEVAFAARGPRDWRSAAARQAVFALRQERPTP